MRATLITIAKAQELETAGITDIALFVTAQDHAASRRKLESFAAEVIGQR